VRKVKPKRRNIFFKITHRADLVAKTYLELRSPSLPEQGLPTAPPGLPGPLLTESQWVTLSAHSLTYIAESTS
jgi:hypothetical protein